MKVDVTRNETIVFPLERRAVLQTYPEFSDLPQDGPQLQVYSFYEIVVEKTLAVTDKARREPRDLYDLWFILDQRHVKHPEELVDGLNRKLGSREGRKNDVLADGLAAAEARLRQTWDARLGNQVEMLPGFDDCHRDVRKLMTDFDNLRNVKAVNK